MSVHGIFLPGYGARASSYARGLPEGWVALQPPSFHDSGGSLARLSSWIVGVVDDARDDLVLGGHSLGGALAIHAAAQRPERVRGLVLFSPAGLPLRHPTRTSIREVARNTLLLRYAPPEMVASATDLLAAPVAARRLARDLERLDVTSAMERVAEVGIPATVIACPRDRLVTLDHCRRCARLLHAELREVDDRGGHTWMYGRWERFADELRRGAAGAGDGVSRSRYPSRSSAARRVAT